MEDFQYRKKIRKTVSSRTFFFVFLIITVALLNGAWGMWRKERNSAKEQEKVSRELEIIKAREEELTASIERLKTSQGVEKEIRQKFSVAKEGEEVVLIVDQTKKNSDSDTEPESLWGKISTWFANIFSRD